MAKGYRNYEEGLSEALKDPKEAAEYLSACLEGGSREVFLLRCARSRRRMASGSWPSGAAWAASRSTARSPAREIRRWRR